MKYIKIISFIFLLLLTYLVFYKVAKWGETYINNTESNLKTDIPQEYLSVINIDSNDVGFSRTILTGESKISSYQYKNNTMITAFKLKMRSNETLNKIINLQTDLINLGIDGGIAYSSIDNQLSTLNYTWDYSKIVVDSVKIHVSKSATVKTIFENDSIHSYFIPNSYGFKLKFNQQKHHDIVGKVNPIGLFEKRDNEPIDMYLSLRKHNGYFYFFIFHKFNNNDEEVNPTVLKPLLSQEK